MFPGATADREDAAYVVVGAPLDVSTTFRPGARFGPERVRKFAWTFEDYHHDFDAHFSELAVHDAGDVHAWSDAEEYLEYLEGILGDVVRDEMVPLLVGGEHTVSVAGLRALEPDIYVTIDAHLDLREAYKGDPYSHGTVAHHAREVADEVVVLGARSGSEPEWRRVRESDAITAVPPEAVADWTLDVDRDASLYLSVDVDGADPAVAPGTGTPEPFGLDARTMRDVVRALAPRADAFDVVEVSDDDDGEAAVLGAKLLTEFVFAHAAERRDY
jgi:agmatinase